VLLKLPLMERTVHLPPEPVLPWLPQLHENSRSGRTVGFASATRQLFTVSRFVWKISDFEPKSALTTTVESWLLQEQLL